MPPLGPNNRLQAMEMSPFSVTGCKISVSHLLSLSAPEQFQSLLYHQYSAVVFNDLVLSGHHCLRHGTSCQEERSPAARILLPSFHLPQESHTVPIRQLCSPLLHALPLPELVFLSLFGRAFYSPPCGNFHKNFPDHSPCFFTVCGCASCCFLI